MPCIGSMFKMTLLGCDDIPRCQCEKPRCVPNERFTVRVHLCFRFMKTEPSEVPCVVTYVEPLKLEDIIMMMCPHSGKMSLFV